MPAGVDGSAIVLQVPHLFHLESLQDDPAIAKVVATKAGDLLERPVTVRFISSDDGGTGPAEEGEMVDLAPEELLDGPSEGVDPAELLANELGAELIDED